MRNNIKYISAGAGSGKTFKLTEIIADLVENGVSMNSVILTTFTKAAAADFRERTREKFLSRARKFPSDDTRRHRLLMASAELDSALIGTVHSVALQYIKKYWYELGISANIVEMDEDEKKEYVKKTLPESADEEDIFAFREYANTTGLGRKAYNNWIDDLSDIIGKADSMDIRNLDLSEKKSLELAKMVLGTDGCSMISDDSSEYPSYQAVVADYIERVFKIARKWRSDFKQYKLDLGLIEFNDMETMFIELLKNKKDVRDEISQSISYLFVDEFQDSNPKQIHIFDLLSDLVKNTVFWVGDKKQSIYRFRGCDTTLVNAISANDNVTKEKPLENNWRSEERIVRSTNEVFDTVFNDSMNPEEIELKPVRGQDLPGGINSLWHWELKKEVNPHTGREIGNASMFMNAIAGQVRKIIDGEHDIKFILDKGENGKQMARPAKAGDIAILSKSNDGIKNMVSCLQAWGIPVIKDEVIDSGNNEILLVQLLLNYFLYKNSSLLKAELAKQMYDKTAEEALSMGTAEIDGLLKRLEDIRTELSGASVSNIVRGVIIRLNLTEVCAKWGCADARRHHLEAVIKAAADFENICHSSGQSATLNAFINTLSEGIKVSGFGEGGVTVTTYHRSKGLEWNIVILTDLQSDPLNTNRMLGRFICGANILRDTAPTKENPYSDYHITFVPCFSNKEFKTTLQCSKNVMATAEWQDYLDQEAEEAKRRLYVGFTRARDYLITTSLPKNKNGSDLVWFKQCGFNATIEADWADGSLQTLWSRAYPVSFQKIVSLTPVAPATPDKYHFHRATVTAADKTQRKRISPSFIQIEGLTEKTRLAVMGETFFKNRIRTSHVHSNETAVGTCIHNIFAAYSPVMPREEMVQMAHDTILNHGLKDCLPDHASIIGSIEELYSWLEKEYGKAVRTDHELPFREMVDGTYINGSIDLVWYTSWDRKTRTGAAVLVDFKNVNGKIENLVNPGNGEQYLGQYASQQITYRNALIRGGIYVRDCILYLALQGRAVKLDFDE